MVRCAGGLSPVRGGRRDVCGRLFKNQRTTAPLFFPQPTQEGSVEKGTLGAGIPEPGASAGPLHPCSCCLLCMESPTSSLPSCPDSAGLVPNPEVPPDTLVTGEGLVLSCVGPAPFVHSVIGQLHRPPSPPPHWETQERHIFASAEPYAVSRCHVDCRISSGC